MSLKNKLQVIPLLLFSIGLFAQQGPGRERIKTLKVGFITEQLSLSSDEAQQFWPVYNAHEQKVEAIRKKERQELGTRFKDLTQVGNKEAREMVATFMEIQTTKHELEQQYIKDLQTVISDIKIIRLFRAEESFKKRLLQQFRKRQAGN